uniref:ABC transporter TMD0 domain-containing protein n=1 Tax=Nothoprocta perdicaria TaxID=30464 RepID=A0A8C6Z7V1_NOTPE
MSSALDKFCGSVFWNSSFLAHADADLPVCFQQTVLVWIPLGFLWIFGPWQLLPMCKHKTKKSSVTKLYIIKQVLAVLLLLTAVAELALTFAEEARHEHPLPVQYTNPSLYIATWILVLVIQDARRFCMRRDSGILFIFWILSLLCGIFPFQSLIRKALQAPISDVPRFVLFYISYGLQLLLFFISGFSDVAAEAKEISKKISVPHSMVIKGYRKPLEMEDLWELKDKDKIKTISAALHKNMKTLLKKAQAEMEKRKRKKKLRESDLDLGNQMNKAQSQDVLVSLISFPSPSISQQ